METHEDKPVGVRAVKMGRLHDVQFAKEIVLLPMMDTGDTSEGDVTLDDGELKRARRWGAAFMVSGLILCDVFLGFSACGFRFCSISYLPAWVSESRDLSRGWLRSAVDCPSLPIFCAEPSWVLVWSAPFFSPSICSRPILSVHGEVADVFLVHLLRSPFPAPPMSCEVLSRCINEYPYSKPQYADVLGLLKDMNCPPLVVVDSMRTSDCAVGV